MSSVVLPVWDTYCHKHKHNLYTTIYDEWQSDSGYNKLIKAKQIFNAGFCSSVWCIDLDAKPTNLNINVKDYLDDEHDFYITKDYNGLNGGSFIIKKSEWSYKFIDWLLQCRGKEKMYCEQDAIAYYMKLFPNHEKIEILPQNTINSYKYGLYPEIPPQTEEQGQWVEGKSLVLHLPGVGIEKRIEILKNTPITNETCGLDRS